MKAKSFNEYKLLRESEELKTDNETNPVGTKVSLGDGNKFAPFEISDDPKSELYGKNKNLAPIVRAFKQGANWGWSRDENTGKDKPVKITSKKLYNTINNDIGCNGRPYLLLYKRTRQISYLVQGTIAFIILFIFHPLATSILKINN